MMAGALRGSARRHPDRPQGHLQHRGHPDHGAFASCWKTTSPTRMRPWCGLGGGRHGDAGQARDARIRLRRAVLRPALAAGAQPVESRRISPPDRRPAPARRWRPAWCWAARAPTPAARSAGPRRCAALAGIKPTYGLASRAGVQPLSFTLDHTGPMAWTAEDCALLLQAMAGHDPADPASADRPVPDFVAGARRRA